MPVVVSLPNKIYEEDVQFSASVSEAVANKLGSTLNYVLDYFDTYVFGVSGAPYSDLSSYPYTFESTLENLRSDCEITNIEIYNEVSGTLSETQFRIEWQPAAGGPWINIFSTDCHIDNTASDNLFFTSDDVSAPSGVTLPIISTSSFLKNDKLRWVLVSAATAASNLQIKVITRPI